MVKPTANLALWVSFISCTGCAMAWTKPGGTEQELNADKLSCEQEAAGKYPVVHPPTSYYRPPPSTKLDTSCVQQSGLTHCDATGNVGTPQSGSQTDANDYNRASAAKACLVSRGYTYKRVER